MTRVHRPGSRPATGHRRVLTAAALLVTLPLAAGVAGSAAASITGYGLVGPDPATQLGLSVPVLTAQVSGPGGSTVRSALADATISLTRPAGYSAGSQVVSLTDLSGSGAAEALVPAELLDGSHIVLGVGVGLRSVDTADAGVEAVPVGADAGAAGEGDSLALQVESPTLAGATVVVVGEDRPRVLPGGTSVTLDLAGPSAVFALAPGPAPADTTVDGVDEVSEEQPDLVQPLAGTAAATGSGVESTGSTTLAGALVLGSLVAAGSGVAVTRRSTRRRPQP